MVEHEICLLTWTLSHIGHVNNTGKAKASISCRNLSIMHSFSVTSANIAIGGIRLKTRYFGLHFRRRQYRLYI